MVVWNLEVIGACLTSNSSCSTSGSFSEAAGRGESGSSFSSIGGVRMIVVAVGVSTMARVAISVPKV